MVADAGNLKRHKMLQEQSLGQNATARRSDFLLFSPPFPRIARPFDPGLNGTTNPGRGG